MAASFPQLALPAPSPPQLVVRKVMPRSVAILFDAYPLRPPPLSMRTVTPSVASLVHFLPLLLRCTETAFCFLSRRLRRTYAVAQQLKR